MNSPSDFLPDLQRGLDALSDASWQLGRTLLGSLGADGAIWPSLNLVASRGQRSKYGLLTCWPTPGAASEVDTTRFKAALFRIKERLRDIAGDDWQKTVVDDGRAVLAEAADSRRILVAWISVVESLTQTAEIEFAGRSGADKKLWVKAITRRLYRKARLNLPMVPRWAEPLVIDGAVDIGIDFVVALNNRDNSWQHDEIRAGTLSWLWWSLPVLLAPLKRLLGAVLQRLLEFGSRLYLAWTNLRLRLTPIPPGLEKALAEIDASGIKSDIAALQDFVTDLTAWLRNNRQRILAFCDLTADAAQEAEWYAGLDGPAKKAYARDLLLAVLDDAGMETTTGLGASLVRFGVDQLIEAVVLLMNKRGALKPTRDRAEVNY